MKKNVILVVFLLIQLILVTAQDQKLSVRWEELTAPDFISAVQLSDSVCVIPMGVLEKHGPHLPLGTDVYLAQDVSIGAAQKEYCVVFPNYFIGQIFEAKHQPGTLSYSSELLFRLLDETCREIARNGMKKIILCNMHGGNNSFLQYFCQVQLEKQAGYAVYLFTPVMDDVVRRKIASMRKTTVGGHADEFESSMVMAIRPDLVKINKATTESGADMDRQKELKNVYTGIWWYAHYPNHYAGDAKDADPGLGKIGMDWYMQQLSEVIRQVKADRTTLRLQNDFFGESHDPLKTQSR